MKHPSCEGQQLLASYDAWVQAVAAIIILLHMLPFTVSVHMGACLQHSR